jgi:hypothetical protein
MIVNPKCFGVSFSIKQCRDFGLNPNQTLKWLIKDAGFRRFRLMSYWNEHEQAPGQLDFSALDAQIEQIAKAGGVITLCLGARQPRWPENHWPDWAWQLGKAERSQALLRYIEAVVKRYRGQPAIISYQLENEALLKSFGTRAEVDRRRLKQEYELIKKLDPERPVIMSTSTSWGIPIRRPIPDIVGFSFYQIVYNSQRSRYTKAFHKSWLHRLRKGLIRLRLRPVFVHELQLEPWGPKAIWEMPAEEQAKSMSPAQIKQNIAAARRIKAQPIDLWGGEWWYWRHKQGDETIWQAVRQAIHQLQ